MRRRVIFPNKVLPYLLLTPQLVITVVFFYWPAVQAVYYSVLLQDPFGLRTTFVWLENFQTIFTDSLYLGSVQGWAAGLENALERAMASHYEVDYVLGVNNLYPSFWDWNDVPWSLNGGFQTFDNGGIQGTFPLLLQYLRTGKRKYFKRAVPTILKHRDVNISWLGPASVTGTQWGNMFTQATYFIPEKFSQASYGMSPVITRGVRWVSTSYEELYLYYLLTGDQRCREIIEGLCQKYQNWGSSSLVGNDIIYASSGWWPKTVSRPTQTPLVYGIDRDDRHYMRNLQAVWEITANNSCREELYGWLGYEVTSSQQAGVARNENYSPILMNNDGRKVTWENIHRYNKLAVPSTTKTN